LIALCPIRARAARSDRALLPKSRRTCVHGLALAGFLAISGLSPVATAQVPHPPAGQAADVGPAEAAAENGVAPPESEDHAVARVERYLTGIDTLHAQFLQTSSNGATASGELWLDRPGKLRFAYDPPTPILIVSNGTLVLYYDTDLEQTSYVPISETPLWFLLSRKVDLSRADNYELAGVTRGPGTLRVSVAQSGATAGSPGSVTLTFQDDPLELKKWRIIDQQGVETVVSLLDPRTGVAVDSDLFDFGALDLPDQTREQKGR